MIPHVTSWLSPFSLLPLFRHAIYNIFAIMSGLGSSTDPCKKKTLSLLKEHPKLKLPSAMCLAQFPEEECRDRAIQTRVWHQLPSKPKAANNQECLPLVSAGVVSRTNINLMPTTAVSSLTDEDTINAASSATTKLFPPSTKYQERKTATSKQKSRIEKSGLKLCKKCAHKWVTLWYAKEKGKKDGLSAEVIAKKVKEESGGDGPSARTILWYVNQLELPGSSPMWGGSPGNIPQWTYISLCTTFESSWMLCWSGMMCRKVKMTIKWQR